MCLSEIADDAAPNLANIWRLVIADSLPSYNAFGFFFYLYLRYSLESQTRADYELNFLSDYTRAAEHLASISVCFKQNKTDYGPLVADSSLLLLQNSQTVESSGGL